MREGAKTSKATYLESPVPMHNERVWGGYARSYGILIALWLLPLQLSAPSGWSLSWRKDGTPSHKRVATNTDLWHSAFMSALQKIRKWRTSPQAGDMVQKPRRGEVVTRKVLDGAHADVVFEEYGFGGKVTKATWSVWCVGATLVGSEDGLHLNPRANKPARPRRKRLPAAQ